MPGLIADHILEQIRQNNDIVEVIGSYFPLKRAGANFRALCPFHKEKTPSFNVNPQKQIWHCFGCGAGGDVFKFVMKYENLDFISAVRRLAERAGIRLEFDESESGGAGRAATRRTLLLKLHEQVAAFFHQTLLKDKAAEPARAYLKKRDITRGNGRSGGGSVTRPTRGTRSSSGPRRRSFPPNFLRQVAWRCSANAAMDFMIGSAAG